MRMEFNDEPYAHGPVKVELEEEEIRVVKANRDGTYQVLVFTGADYRFYPHVKITAFISDDDSDGVWCKMATKEVWDSWGKVLPEKCKTRPATQTEWDQFFKE